VTTYTYDPSGTTSATGSANDWPFQYQGMEKEFTDPSTYYYTGGGQFYSPQLSRSLSEVGETSSSQGACPSGNAIGAHSGSSGFGISFPSSVGAEPETSSEGQTGGTIITITGAAAVGAIIGAVVGAAVGNPLAGAVLGAVVGAIAGDIANFLFGDLFGGGSPPIPRQLRHQRHPLYPAILGLPAGLIPDEMSEGLKVIGDPDPSPATPLYTPTPTPTEEPIGKGHDFGQWPFEGEATQEQINQFWINLCLEVGPEDATRLLLLGFQQHGAFSLAPGAYVPNVTEGCDPNRNLPNE
jgi:hypothetical protein